MEHNQKAYGIPGNVGWARTTEMCHCYPMLTFFPEGKRAYEEITALLSQD